uniref:hypothetical protein n=1 Tax=Escherichia coli TaxID=562 RepID=UPI002034457E|nr:hypothetical protein [Escherichia coli]
MGHFFQLTYRDGSLDGMWIVRDVNNLRLIQLGDNCAGMQVSTSEPRNTSSLKSLFDTSMYQPLDIPEAPSVNEAASPPQTPLELPQPRLNAPVAEEASSVAEQTNAHSEPDSVIATEYEQYGHLLEETLDSDGEAYSDLIASDSTEAEYPPLIRRAAILPNYLVKRPCPLRPVIWITQRVPLSHQHPMQPEKKQY